MKKMLSTLFAIGALSSFALDNTIEWNGFWDTTGYVNPAPSEMAATSDVPVCLCFSDTAVSDCPAWFETFSPGYLLFLR